MKGYADSRADEILSRHSALVTERSLFEGQWREIEERISSKGRFFQTQAMTQGMKSTERIFDVTLTLAADRFASAMESMLTPRTQRWHKLRASDPSVAEVKAVQIWCEQATDVLFAARYAPGTGFAAQLWESYWSTGSYGTGTIFLDDDVGRKLTYRACHLSEIFLATNESGLVDTIHRVRMPTIRQIAQRFGVDALPEKYKDWVFSKPDNRLEVLHCVKPRQDYKDGRRDYMGRPWGSTFVLVDSRSVLEENGYRTMPYCTGRFTTSPREDYGRGPGIMVLPEVKMLNEQRKTILRAAQKVVDPPLLLPEDGLMRAFDLRAGALNYGGTDSQGRQLVHPLNTQARIDIGKEEIEDSRTVINDAFLVNLFQILVQNPQMTATEAMLRAQEKGELLAPTMGRVQSEQIGSMIERELDILSVSGRLPPMPDELIEAGGLIEIEYESPLNQLQKSGEAVAILRSFEAAGSIAQSDPSALKQIDTALAVRKIFESNGAPASILRTPEQMKVIEEQDAEAAEAADLLAAAPVAAATIKDLTAAQAQARSAPSPLSP